MKHRKIVWLLVPVAAVAAIMCWNYFTVQRPMSSKSNSDPRNDGLSITAHYQWYVNPSVLVFDLRGFSDTNSEADVLRNLFQCAHAMKSHSFDRIILEYKGNPRFILKGTNFKQVGNEYGYQNPVYTLRTLPQHVYNLNGMPAFGTWTGGLLGVVVHQMQDLNTFGRQWFLADAANGN